VRSFLLQKNQMTMKSLFLSALALTVLFMQPARSQERFEVFPTRTEAMMFLRDQGCTRIKTDKGVVDPTSVKLRDEIGKVDGKRVSKLEVGIDYDGRAYLMAEDMDGRRYRTDVTIDNPFKERKEIR